MSKAEEIRKELDEKGIDTPAQTIRESLGARGIYVSDQSICNTRAIYRISNGHTQSYNIALSTIDKVGVVKALLKKNKNLFEVLDLIDEIGSVGEVRRVIELIEACK